MSTPSAPHPQAGPGDGRALTRAAIVVAIFALLAGLARLVQDAAIAWRHGAGAEVDAYWFVINLVSWPVAVALSTLTFFVAPAEAGLRHDASALRRFRSELLGWVLVVAALAWPAAGWALQALLSSRLTGLGTESAALARDGARLAAVLVPLGLIGALLSAWLISSAHRVVTLLEGVAPLCLAALLIAMPGMVLYWGTAAGVGLQVLAIGAVLLLAGGLPRPRLGFTSTVWRTAWRGGAAMLAGQIVFSLVPLVDQFFAARLGEGTLAALGYANRLLLGVQGLAGVALQRASLPLLSQLASQSPAQARQTSLRWAAWAGGAGALMAAAVVALADPVVSLLFERGSFSAQDRQDVVMLLRWGSLQLPIFLAGLVLVTALASMRAGALLMWLAALGFGVKLLMNLLLVSGFGAVGIQFATALMYLCTMAATWFALSRHRARPG